MFDITLNDGILTVSLFGRIDTSNAEAVTAEVEAIRAENAHTAMVFDAEKLEYISSAGLRFVLKIRKEEPTLKMINTSAEVYDIFEMTGFSEMMPVEKAYRRMTVDGCEIIGQGAKGTVYRFDPETIVKVYKNPDSLPDIQNERALAKRAFVLGIPTAISYDIVKVGESYGSVFELLAAKSFSQMIAEEPENIEKYVKMYAELLRKIHETPVRAEDMPDIKKFVLDWMNVDTPFLAPASAEKLKAMIAAVPEQLTMLHCDYHTNNVLMQNGEALLIDMDTLSHGHPVFELANVYITYVGFGEKYPEFVEKFIGLPYDTCKKIWEIFLPAYLGTDDRARIEEVENKAKLVNYVRLMRHYVRRGADTPEAKVIAPYCREKIEELLTRVDTLVF